MTQIFTLTLCGYIAATVAYLGYFVSQQEKVRSVARFLLTVAGLVHTLYLITCYLQAGHTPLTSRHEAISFMAWAMTWAFLSFRYRYKVVNFGAFVSPLITLLMVVAAHSSKVVLELPLVLRSGWLPVHASIAIVANSFLALAFCGGVMYLLLEREIKKKRFGLFYSRLPSLEALDSLNQHCLTVGFALMTLGLVTGVFWAKQAWGTFWRWEPKMVWALITWFLYTMGWRRRRAAIMAIIGFAAVLFTFWGASSLGSGESVHVFLQPSFQLIGELFHVG